MTARPSVTLTAALGVALAAALATGPLFAQTNVGVVDFDAVFGSSKRALAVFADVEAFRVSKAAEFKKLTDAYQEKLRNLQAGVGLSDAEQSALSQELRAEQTRIKRLQEDAEREGQRLTNQALAVLDKELRPLIQALAQEKNLQLILQATPDSGIVFADPAIDITQEVAARLDAQQP